MYLQPSFIIAAIAGLAAAGPIETRQFGLGGTGTTSKEFSQGGCRDILFAWARGSTEIGNMVREHSMCSEFQTANMNRVLLLDLQPPMD